MSLKKLIRKIHLILGLSSGIVVFIVAVTGCLYCFEKEIRQVIYRGLYELTATGNERAPISSVVELAKKSQPGKPVRSVTFPSEPDKSIQINFKNKTTVFVDPYQLQVLGELNMEKEFFGVVLNLHRSLLLGDAGKMITGISALIFLVMIISGIIMWWPTNKRSLRASFTIKKEASTKRFNLDLHRVLGFYGSFILIFSVLSGLIFAFKWAEAGMFWLSGSKKEQTKVRSKVTAGGEGSIDLIAATVLDRFPEQAVTIVFPEDTLSSYRATITETNNSFFKKQHHLFFDQYSGAVLKEKMYDQGSAGEHLRAANYDIHTGKVLGLFGQLLVFCASAIAASLPVTGFLIWFRRQQKKGTVTLQSQPVERI